MKGTTMNRRLTLIPALLLTPLAALHAGAAIALQTQPSDNVREMNLGGLSIRES